MFGEPPFDITKPDNPADVTVTITISGNAFVSLLNTCDQLGYLEKKGDWNEEKSRTKWIIERCRDQLSFQRMLVNKERQANP